MMKCQWHLPARERRECARAMRGRSADDDHLDRRRPAADLRGSDDGGLHEFLHDFPAIPSTRIQSVDSAQPAQTGIYGDVARLIAGKDRSRTGRISGMRENAERRLQLLGSRWGGEAYTVNHEVAGGQRPIRCVARRMRVGQMSRRADG